MIQSTDDYDSKAVITRTSPRTCVITMITWDLSITLLKFSKIWISEYRYGVITTVPVHFSWLKLL